MEEMLGVIQDAINFASTNIRYTYRTQYDYHCHVSMTMETPLGPQLSECDLIYSFRPDSSKRPVWTGFDPRFTVSGGPLLFEISKGLYLVALTDFLPTPERIFYPGRSMNEVFKSLTKIRLTRCLALDDYPVFVLLSNKNGCLKMQRLDVENMKSFRQFGFSIRSIHVTIGSNSKWGPSHRGEISNQSH